MDLLAFERKLDSTIMRKRLDIQEALKRPVKVEMKILMLFFFERYLGAVILTSFLETIDSFSKHSNSNSLFFEQTFEFC